MRAVAGGFSGEDRVDERSLLLCEHGDALHTTIEGTVLVITRKETERARE